ncbi:MAG: AzlD domain-containing protein [Acidimicrobiia bacterium]
MSWWVIAVLAAGAYSMKALGVFAGGSARRMHPAAEHLIGLLPVALLPALIMVQTFGDGRRLVIDARAVGLVAGALCAWRRLPFLVVVVAAGAATALVRLAA